MSDYERYMDYNGVHDDDDQLHPPTPWVPVVKRILKYLCVAVAVSMIAVIVIRFAVAGWYPKMAKQLYLTDPIREEYAASGEISVLTQELIVPVENRTDGFYHADNLLVIDKTGSLQCSLRVNRNAFDDMAERYGIADPEAVCEALSFTLYYQDAAGVLYTYEATYVASESHMWYEYFKICFDGVEFDGIPWYRLNIHVAGVEDTEEEPTACIAVYQNDLEYNQFETYLPSEEELP